MNMVGQYACGFSEKNKIGIMKIHQELAVLSEFEEVQMWTEKTKTVLMGVPVVEPIGVSP